MSLITLNDISAFYVGFFLGRTPLIRLSPKKTREGFAGGAALTVTAGAALCHWLTSRPELVCPVRGEKHLFFDISINSSWNGRPKVFIETIPCL